MEKYLPTAVSTVVIAGLVLSLATILPFTTAMTAQAKPDPVTSAGLVEKFRIAGKIADAHWYTEDLENKIFTDVFLFVVEIDPKSNLPFTETFLDLIIFQYRLVETCEEFDGQVICYYDFEPLTDFYGSAVLDASEYSITNNFRSASVSGVEVSGIDFVSEEEKTVIVDASWIGDGGLIKIKQSSSEAQEDYRITYKANGLGRDATATADFSGDIELSLDESTYSDATVMRVREGFMIRELKH